MTRPRSAAPDATTCATVGVGTTPSSRTCAPSAANPAAAAASSISPDGRVSRPMATVLPPSTRTALRATASASSGVRTSPLASPRIPSVPNSRAMKPPEHAARRPRNRDRLVGDDLALGVLRSLAGLLEPVLLALLDPRVAGEEAGLLQRRAVVGLDLLQR